MEFRGNCGQFKWQNTKKHLEQLAGSFSACSTLLLNGIVEETWSSDLLSNATFCHDSTIVNFDANAGRLEDRKKSKTNKQTNENEKFVY